MRYGQRLRLQNGPTRKAHFRRFISRSVFEALSYPLSPSLGSGAQTSATCPTRFSSSTEVPLISHKLWHEAFFGFQLLPLRVPRAAVNGEREGNRGNWEPKAPRKRKRKSTAPRYHDHSSLQHCSAVVQFLSIFFLTPLRHRHLRNNRSRWRSVAFFQRPYYNHSFFR